MSLCRLRVGWKCTALWAPGMYSVSSSSVAAASVESEQQLSGTTSFGSEQQLPGVFTDG
jgi:hypothetical protein